VFKDKTEDNENADNSENTEETLEDEVYEHDIKTESIEESLGPVDVDIAGEEGSEEGTNDLVRAKCLQCLVTV
jgi:hypothetical protein